MVISPRQQQLSDTAAAATLLLLGILLVVIGAGLAGQWVDSASRHQEPGSEDILGVAAAAVGSLLVAWWLLAFVLAAGSALLERIGRPTAAAAVGWLSPAFMRRLAVAALSAQLVSVTAANAAVPGPPWQPAESRTSIPGISAPAPPLPGALHPGWQPAAQHQGPGLLAGSPGHPGNLPGQDLAPAGPAVTVLAGDSLWDIAADHLGPEASDADIAVEWPRWYQANRAVIGPDPDHLLPGQVLVPPGPA